MASIASSVKGIPKRFAYGTTKAAVIGLTKAVAADFRAARVCAATRSARARSRRPRCSSGCATPAISRRRTAFVARQPMGRLGQAEEIAALALYLASDESSFTTGAIHVIDGGWIN
jgi:2-keto-3-deoxy-L-fuconate dehydrogenase